MFKERGMGGEERSVKEGRGGEDEESKGASSLCLLTCTRH